MATAAVNAPKKEYFAFHQSLRNLYYDRENDDDADLITIICGGKCLKVHKFLLNTRSKFFATACKGPFKEAATREIHLPDDDLFLVARLIRHCYMFDYSSEAITVAGQKEDTHVSELHTNVHLYALAEKYDFSDLKREAMDIFNCYLKTLPPAKGVPNMQTVIDIIPAIYETTPDSDHGLRGLVVAYAADHWETILDMADVQDNLPLKFVFEVSAKLCEKLRDLNSRWL